MISRTLTFALTAFMGICLGGVRASAISYGTLDNFDVINDTGEDCHGFQIELEGISSSDAVYTFGAPYQRYGDPTIISTATGVIIRYEASYDPGTMSWSATTPYTAPPYLPTQGHSCWIGGVADPAQYYSGGCDHFGASLNVSPTSTTYRWLVETSPGSGTLTPVGTSVQLPAPVWNVQPQPVGPPIVQVAIRPPHPAQSEFGDAIWVKVFVTELHDGLKGGDLDHMVIDDPNMNIVPHEAAEIEVEWSLMQAGKKGDGEQDFGGKAGADSKAVSRRFEFYKYVGLYDAESHEALCDNAGSCPDAIGDIIGAQNVAVNLAGAFALPSRAVGDFDNSGCTELNDFLTLLDNWGLDYQGTVMGLADFLALLDNWITGVSCV